MLDRLSPEYRETSSQHLENADGTKTSKEKWFSPDDGVLPPPLSKKKLDEVRNSSKENKDVLRKMVREKEKYVVAGLVWFMLTVSFSYMDTSGVLDE
jgi:hypothetical protein